MIVLNGIDGGKVIVSPQLSFCPFLNEGAKPSLLALHIVSSHDVRGASATIQTKRLIDHGAKRITLEKSCRRFSAVNGN